MLDKGWSFDDCSKMKNWIVVIADIVGSRNVANRSDLQKKLKLAVEEVNAVSASIYSPCTVTLGDEIQTVYCNAKGLFADLWWIRNRIYPQRMRMSVAAGGIETEMNTESAIGMDGPVFHAARDSLTEMKTRALPVFVSGLDSDQSQLINDSLMLIFKQAERWKKNRMEIQARLLRDESPMSIADSMDLTRSAVYQNIRRASMFTTTSIQKQVEVLLEDQIRNG